jgi:hypothetical protein
MRPNKPRLCIVVVVIGVGVEGAFGAAAGAFPGRGVVSCAKALDIIRMEKMMAGRIIERLQHESERYQSSMKSIFASLIVAFLAISATGKDRHCVFRVHAEANPNDTASFASSVRALFSGKEISIERIPRLSERDVVAFYPYEVGSGNYGALFQLDEHGRIALDAFSVDRRGSLLFVLINGRAIAELQTDQRVSDGQIYIASGLSKADIEIMKKDWRFIGQKKKR